MNLKKKYRLGGKEIRYIMRAKHNKKVFFSSLFIFHMIEQYPNQPYNKFSINISIKAGKKAVFRNVFKRFFMDEIYKKDLKNKKISGKYWKIFVSINKKNISIIKKLSENKPIKKEEIRSLISKDLDFFVKKLR